MLGVFIWEKKGIGKLLSCRFVVYGGPLLSGNEAQKRACLDLLLGELVKRTKRKALFIQFRNFFSWEGDLDVFEKHGFTLLDRLNFIVRIRANGERLKETGDQKQEMRAGKSEFENIKPATSNKQPVADFSEQILSKFSTTRRRQIRKGLTGGAEIIEPENLEQVREFYDILYRLYRYKVRKPLADWSFFESFYNQTLPQTTNHKPHTGNNETVKQWNNRSIGIIRLIRYNDCIIGGILAPVFETKCIYEWYVCGLDKEYKEQYPSVLATWAAIDFAAKNDIKNFDFMGVGRPDIPYGVREFKVRFGGEMVNYGRLTRINNRLLYHIAEFGFNVLALFKKI
jgi:lipid II:glycine glycyltransferase (peptidoglycan interpeptide bridge formation enzyme)